MRFFSLIYLALQLIFFASCNTNSSVDNKKISSAPETIAAGKLLFKKNCAACHNFKQDGIGPNLGGITTKVSADWLHQFIKDPARMLSAEDTMAVELKKKYKTVMPGFSVLKNDELDAVIAFLNTEKNIDSSSFADDNRKVKDPIPEKIKLSSLLAEMKQVAQFPPSGKAGEMPATRITKLDFEPATGNLFVNDLRGKLYKLIKGKPIVYMDLKKLFPAFTDEPGLATGFGSFTFHPGFAKNGIFYTTHTELPGSGKADFTYADSIKVTVQWVITEWKTKNPAAEKFSGTSKELMRINMVSGAHGVQELTFNTGAKKSDRDYGLLYIGVGDGASVQEGYSFIPHSKKSIWGTVLRIDPLGSNSVNGKYGIPVDNPFANAKEPEVVKEIYAYGFRNPHRITWTQSGEMLVSNIGQANIEAIDLIKAGHDYGWPIREGQFVFNPKGNLNNIYPLTENDSIYKITYPVVEFDHDEGSAITGGYEYEGNSIPQLRGKFLFGDIPSGRLFYVNTDDIKQGALATVREWRISVDGSVRSLKQICGQCDRVDLRFGRDGKGEMYILTKNDGRLYKIESAKE